MRIAIFSESAVGYVGYPEALYGRGLAWGLAQRGHAVRMLEERRNPALRRTLERVGSSASRQAFENYPRILIHSFEPRTGARLMEWVARELSLVDVAVAIDGTADELTRWIANLDHPKLVRVFITYREGRITPERAFQLEIERFDLRYAGERAPAGLSWERIQPCLAPQDRSTIPTEYLPDDAIVSDRDPIEVAEELEAAILRLRRQRA